MTFIVTLKQGHAKKKKSVYFVKNILNSRLLTKCKFSTTTACIKRLDKRNIYLIGDYCLICAWYQNSKLTSSTDTQILTAITEGYKYLKPSLESDLRFPIDSGMSKSSLC